MGLIVKSEKYNTGKKSSSRRPETPQVKMNTTKLIGKSRATKTNQSKPINVKKVRSREQLVQSNEREQKGQSNEREHKLQNFAPQSQQLNESGLNENSSYVSNYSSRLPPSQKQKPGPISLRNRIRLGKERRHGDNDEIGDLRYLIEEGPLSFRAIAMVGAFFMILSSVLDLIDGEDDDLTAMQGLISVLMWFFGIITLTLEGRPYSIQIPVLYTFFAKFFGCFRYVWGRGFFYFTAGCLQFFLFTKYDMISGVIFMLLGIASIISGYKASVKLAGLRNSIGTRDDIKYLFHNFDTDRDGYLNVEEFRDLMITLDQDVSYNDFVAALSSIDMDNNQKISEVDMERWYVEYSESELPVALSCCSNGRYDQRFDQKSRNPDYKMSPNAHLLT